MHPASSRCKGRSTLAPANHGPEALLSDGYGRSCFSAATRKRAGVEPAQDRSATPTGFEVRPTHRGRFSSAGDVPPVTQVWEAGPETWPPDPVPGNGSPATAARHGSDRLPDGAALAVPRRECRALCRVV